MKTRRMTTGIAALTLALSAGVVPQAMADDREVGDIPVEELLSYSSSEGTQITPEETLTIEPDHYDDRLPLLRAFPEETNQVKWEVDLDTATGDLTVTAPAAPGDQGFGTQAEYGDVPLNVRTNEGRSVYVTIEFVEEKTDDEKLFPGLSSSSSSLVELSSRLFG